MRKTDKKRDKQIRLALTEVCDQALKDIAGFNWLTHIVDYNAFPDSLKVICVFADSDHLEAFLASRFHDKLHQMIIESIADIGVATKPLSRQIHFVTEQQAKAGFSSYQKQLH